MRSLARVLRGLAGAARRGAAVVCLLAFTAGLGSAAFGQLGRVDHEDSNGDGRVDLWRYYDPHGHVDSAFHDTNFDGRVDQVAKYRHDQLVRLEIDTDFDHRIDLVREFDLWSPVHAEEDLAFTAAVPSFVMFEPIVRLGLTTCGVLATVISLPPDCAVFFHAGDRAPPRLA